MDPIRLAGIRLLRLLVSTGMPFKLAILLVVITSAFSTIAQ